MFWNRKPVSCGLDDSIPLSTAIDNVTFTVFDTETTGFQVATVDRPIEIAAVRMRGSSVLETETFQMLINPGRPIPTRITELTGITNEDTALAANSQEALTSFFQFVEAGGTHALVGHYISFDLLVLKHELARHQQSFKKPLAIDTFDLIGYLTPSWDMRDLERYAMAFGTRIYDRHRALGDSLTTAYLFQELLQQCQTRGITTWGDLLTIVKRPSN